AEGLPGKRYYGGCEFVDVVEELARTRALELFGLTGEDYGVNVQPHSGAQANAAVYLAAIKPGDTIMGLDLSNGGHLTHGSPVNSSGKLYRAVPYHVTSDGLIDLDEVRDIARRERPQLIMTGASAYPRLWDFEAFRQIADEVGAVLVADIAHVAGLVAVGLHPSPFGHCDYITTTTHKTLRGPRGGLVFARASLMKGMNSAVFPGSQGGPLMHVIAGKAVAFGEALRPEFRTYMQQVLDNAKAMARRLMTHGFVLVSGGTDNHLMLVDLSKCPYSGKDAERTLGLAGITVNKNTVPNEPRSPFVTSGIRIGTPAMTTRGCVETDAILVADWIAEALEHRDDATRLAEVRFQVHELMRQRPVPTDRPVHDEDDGSPDWDCNAHGEGAGSGTRTTVGYDPDADAE
ncbi:MAG: serine hydroxymethyltransferase, partial [Candidatus Kerfeldbacteria bacterium]|nr:serine hydroxymethyltransferase [Candidatus Kerfeldbacteria bacterium]